MKQPSRSLDKRHNPTNIHKLKLFAFLVFLQLHFGAAYVVAQTEPVTRQETLRGSVTPEREWWDLLHYHLKVEFLLETRRLKGSNEITFKTLKPIIGVYGTNRQGSGDMYPKGGNMLHTIRHLINDDAKWLAILHGLNTDFWHQTVTTEQIESYIATKAGIDLSKVFDQYLRTTDIPLLKYSVNGKSVSFSYERVVKGFAMPLRVNINGKETVITPTEAKQTLAFPEEIKTFGVNRNFYIETEKI